jgi:NAD(P)-dependent dehydrogenase (short-subunit alcohol dehydrogenase family)
MSRSLILGGTKGLGRSLALESVWRGLEPLIVGRSVDQAKQDPAMAMVSHLLFKADLSDPYSLLSEMNGPYWQEITHVFWVAGIFSRKPLAKMTTVEMRQMIDTHLYGPLGTLSFLHRLQQQARPLAEPPGQPYHLVVIASTSSWKMRENEALYCALKAAKAHLTRNFARELVGDLPGSKVTLVNPGGIRTPNFWQGTDQAMGQFMDPDELAVVIWDQVMAQSEPFQELQVPRDDQGKPVVIRGPQPPGQPF